MKKLLLLAIYATFASLPTFASQDWISEVIRLKSGFSDESKFFETDLILYDTPLQKVTIDVKGEKYLSLYCRDGNGNGTGYDQGVWGNAALYTASGEKVYLDEIASEYEDRGWNPIMRNVNYKGEPITSGGKGFDHAIITHAYTHVVFKLDGKYDRFEAEVGVESSGGDPAKSSLILQVLNGSPRLDLYDAAETNPEIHTFLLYSKLPIEKWLMSSDGSVEREALVNIIAQLEDGYNFTNEMKLVDGSNEMRIRKYLTIYMRAVEVLRLQNELAMINLPAIKLAHENMKKMEGYDAVANAKKIAELEAILRKGLIAICYYDANKLAEARRAIALKREILLANPMLDVDRIMATHYVLGSEARTAMAPKLGTEANNWSNIQSAARRGFDGSLIELNNVRDIDPTIRTIYKPEDKVSIAHPRMHWDADRVMFSQINEMGLWNVFEVPIDGDGEAKEIIKTDDPDLEFFDATYLPSGRISAISNIGYQGVPCVDGSDPVGNMVLFDPEKGSLRRLTFDQDANWNPIVMNNGRVMYTRWEYTDLTHYFSRIVMHMNPDGTEAKALYGSNKFFPNSTFDVQPLPGHGSRFISIASGHHGIQRSGRLLIFDPAKGRTSVDGLVQEIPHKDKIVQPLIKDELVNGVWPQFIKPYPVTDEYFLVAAKPTEDALWGIYLVDVFDNMTLIIEAEGEGFNAPILIEKRPTPPVIPDKVNLESKESTVFIQDIYEGAGLPGVPRGEVKELRVFAYEYAYVKSPSNNSAQGIQSGWDIKRLLGTVKVEDDGSATFKIPANTPISLQPLDSEGRAIQWMRSWLTGMPGEVVSCIGCHEDQNMLPIPKRTAASTKAPSPITPPEGGSHSVSFNSEIQPMLTRACVACHNENSKLNFTGGRVDDKEGFNLSYLAFHPYVSRQGSEADAEIMTPYEYHVNTSEIVQKLKRGHHGVELTEKEWQDLYIWIDLNAPDKGAFVQNDLNGYEQISRRVELGDKYNNVTVNWQQEMQDYMAYLEAKGPITPVMPEKSADPNYKSAKAPNWPFTADKAKAMQGDDNRKVIEIAPGVSMAFVRIPAGTFVMGSNKAGSDMAPETKVTIKKSFWISETEVTNEQFVTIDPTHDSRIIAQMWKDHTNAGYVANRPGQPVIRVSWQEAMDYCQSLGQKLGVSMNLPTEAQWEWAAAAGSGTEMWFGDRNTDFSEYDNMADAQLKKMAVIGVDPQPMEEGSYWYDYYNFLPKIDGVNDGQMIVAETGMWYKPNPWGLYDVHGNVEEWTRSDYKPYPYLDSENEESAWKVARGGSWRSRPKDGTLYTRKAYMPWQKVNNVGFRVIIEE